ncbi:hypothetical protein BDW02DRAFT_355100 [Decorospora gaudefroyi]|uniref:Uncharacterized protein n=1 Tax=Decorospora gaudefroyi TaxID=184978 RepID=A0A6A5K9G0_9PLEO|nr:hypothetical protein BDW02DRAFT_355100 [Decorospora gaudefroyi]
MIVQNVCIVVQPRQIGCQAAHHPRNQTEDAESPTEMYLRLTYPLASSHTGRKFQILYLRAKMRKAARFDITEPACSSVRSTAMSSGHQYNSFTNFNAKISVSFPSQIRWVRRKSIIRPRSQQTATAHNVEFGHSLDSGRERNPVSAPTYHFLL